MDLTEITPLLLTLDERDNLPRTLRALDWADQIVVIDSGSSDGTLELLSEDPRAVVHRRGFDTHGQQWSFGLSRVQTPWALTLDADHVVSAELSNELRSLDPPPETGAYAASFVYCVEGLPIRSGIYPPKPVLLRTGRCRFEDDGHTQRVVVSGEVASLRGKIQHDDRKPFHRWLSSQRRYAALEATKLRSGTFWASLWGRWQPAFESDVRRAYH